ncbi:D-alanyl-D-alanine carboxypeptidase family protein [Oricola cellulosilytica]|uniref:D-alanyl-D-alanine carboxypeptidase family protein n=1 Tax=Oricola cellulosilytica TaxID=1429082 RepID=UPI0018EE8AA4|nr:D-alanyl-D-alanine carboxypeptidase family protein [Oricola cellulosilytica]
MSFITRRSFHAIALLCITSLAACTTSSVLEIPAPQADPQKYAAIIVDAKDGTVLYAKAADEPRYPASLTKMMTLYLLFEAIDQGRLSRMSQIPVSANAATKPASKLYLKPGETIGVDTAIRALAVKSANDVATAVAEQLAGSEEAFAYQMTAKARALGMRSTVFTNASGLPDPQMRTTARDMALLSLALRRNFPHYYSYFSLRSFDYNGKTIRGHNKVLEMVAGADGIKTGYVRASGYNLAASVQRSGKSLVGVVMGGDSGGARDAHMTQLLTASFNRARRR